MVVLWTILAAIAALILILSVNTAVKVCAARKLKGEHPAFTEAELQVYADSLRQMLRCKTVSVKGSYDDTEFAKLRDVVKEQFPLLHEKAERYSFLRGLLGL